MKRSVFGLFLLCSDGKPNTDARLEDNADAKLIFFWAVRVEISDFAWWESREDEWESARFPRALLFCRLYVLLDFKPMASETYQKYYRKRTR